MTTKFENSIINPLTRAPHNNFAVNNSNTLIIHQCYQIPESNLPPPSMDRILKSQKIESMRKMMLMQEQLFKQQVEELHRLYNMQKKLMQEIENGLKQRKETRAANYSEFAIRNIQTGSESKQSFQELSARKNYPNEVISGRNSAENARTPMKFDLETAGESTPIASSSMHPFEELKRMDDVEVELTLSIGHHCSTRKQRSDHLEMRQLEDSDSRRNEVLEAAASSSSSTVYNQENTRPHWLLQDLSLNNTT